MTLPQETQDIIEKEAEAYGESHGDHIYNIKEYYTHNNVASAYQAGATEWVGKAQPVVDAVQGLIEEVDTEGLTQDRLEELKTAIAKYKEVVNG
jgi:hypothetical protein